jgi:C_GCAxxG_C_C family probable redox protein
MISRGENRFNCCESVLLRIDEKLPLPGFDADIMRVASAYGGGVMGWGSVCGAAAGACMALGLIDGTDGDETPSEYLEMRAGLREIGQDFLKAFEEEFSSVNCVDLLGVDRRTEEGKRRYEELKTQDAFRSGEYVEWSADKILEMRNES